MPEMTPVEQREAITLENQQEKIFAIMHRPLLPKSEKVPAVLFCSGFAGTKSGKFRVFTTLAKELAKQGIAALRFDYRGAGDSEGDFCDMTLEGNISDTLLCLDFLSRDPQIDTSRIGLFGRSLGGVIAILAASRFQSIKSLSLWAPVFKSDPWKLLWNTFKAINPRDPSKLEIMRHLPADAPNLTFLEEFFKIDIESELKSLQKIPLFHIHGVLDQVVKIEQAREYERVRNGLPNTRFLQLPNTDHDFSDREEQTQAIQETCKWYKTTLWK